MADPGRWPWELVGRYRSDRRMRHRRARCWAYTEMQHAIQIEDAHRRLLIRVHPDRGGSNEAVHEANHARDLLLADAAARSETEKA
jgi:DnaJ family protein C protein 19